MKFYILLFAIASMQFVIDAQPLSDLKKRNVDGELSDILSNIPDDIDTDELIRILHDFMNRDVSEFFLKSLTVE